MLCPDCGWELRRIDEKENYYGCLNGACDSGGRFELRTLETAPYSGEETGLFWISSFPEAVEEPWQKIQQE